MLKQTGYSREAPLLPAILRFSIPLMLTGILQLAYNTADSIIVGRYAGHASLAAVGSTTSIIFLIITLFNGVSIGIHRQQHPHGPYALYLPQNFLQVLSQRLRGCIGRWRFALTSLCRVPAPTGP